MSYQPPLLTNLTEAAERLARANGKLTEAEKRVEWAIRDRNRAREAAAREELMVAEMVSRCIPELRHTVGDELAARRLHVIESISHHLSGGRTSEASTIARDYLHELRPGSFYEPPAPPAVGSTDA